MVKRKELMKRLRNVAKERDLEFAEVEGANHTRVWVGKAYTTVPGTVRLMIFWPRRS